MAEEGGVTLKELRKKLLDLRPSPMAEGGSVTLEELRKKLEDFGRVRNWEPHHTPRNLVLALVGEVGELAEIFQWKGEVARGIPDWEEEEKQHLGEELADVLLYVVRLADMCGVDLGEAALRKIELNGIKYPAPAVGSNDESHEGSGS